ncbi:MAG TPA: Tim44-like domain-containing protein [Casimicrobiaceae bacterium]|nr:Tim44-like domain-containing protein [Casimicrobiaceae bacterium]
MKRFLALSLTALAATTIVAADFADARRLGSGRNLGAQRQSVAPPASPSAPAATPAPAGPTGAAANPVMPAGSRATAGAPATAAAAAPAAAGAAARTGMSRWMGPVAGLAAGLGLAWLAHSLGFSEALLSALLIGLGIVVVLALVRAFLVRRNATQQPSYAGGPTGRVDARNTQRTGSEPRFGGGSTQVATENASGRFPPGFAASAFLNQARGQFTRLQAAYDKGDRDTLADVMTPELFGEVSRDLDTRGVHHATEIVSLNPELVEVTTEGDRHWASVRFTGLIREDGATYPKPFDEMWNLTKPVDDSSGWLLAGIRQLEPST